jgi:hypothetical protein
LREFSSFLSCEELIFYAPLFSRKSAEHNSFGHGGNLLALPVFRTFSFLPISGMY